MGKLDRIEKAVIFFVVWLAWFGAALLYTSDWPRAFGSSWVTIAMAWAAIGTIDKRRGKKAQP